MGCMWLPSGKITCGPGVVLNLFLHGVSTLMYFCVAPVSAMPYVFLLLGGFPLQLLELLLFFINIIVR